MLLWISFEPYVFAIIDDGACRTFLCLAYISEENTGHLRDRNEADRRDDIVSIQQMFCFNNWESAIVL